jgi:hypothetical protein
VLTDSTSRHRDRLNDKSHCFHPFRKPIGEIHSTRMVQKTIRDYPHYFNTAFVGVEFATELIAIFYQTMTFLLNHQADVAAFLSADLFGTKIVPSEHVTSLRIHVSLNRFNQATGVTGGWSSPKFAFPIKRHYLEALKAMQSLKVVVPKRRAILILDLSYLAPRWTHRMVEILVPFVYDMKEKGWTVKVDNSRHIKNKKHVASCVSYDMTRAEWEEKIKNNSCFVSPSG